MKKMFAVAALAILGLGALSAITPTYAIDCSAVRCAACPDGYRFAPTGNNCCRCVKAH